MLTWQPPRADISGYILSFESADGIVRVSGLNQLDQFCLLILGTVQHQFYIVLTTLSVLAGVSSCLSSLALGCGP